METAALDGLLGQLLSKGVVGRSPHEEGEWISNVFLHPKPGGEYRMILDLTDLNTFIVYEHFKMFSLQTAVELVEEGCWMASIDLKDAYYSVSVSRSGRSNINFCEIHVSHPARSWQRYQGKTVHKKSCVAGDRRIPCIKHLLVPGNLTVLHLPGPGKSLCSKTP